MIKPLDKVALVDKSGNMLYGLWKVVTVERGKTPEEYYCVSELTEAGHWFTLAQFTQKSIVNKSPKIKCTNKR